MVMTKWGTNSNYKLQLIKTSFLIGDTQSWTKYGSSYILRNLFDVTKQ